MNERSMGVSPMVRALTHVGRSPTTPAAASGLFRPRCLPSSSLGQGYLARTRNRRRAGCYNDYSKIECPGGGAVEAPNAKAAGAVRAAIGQLGTPYVWGGTTPGRGFDCSGLTQWAYAQEGVEIERKSTYQTEGQQVSQENLAPGDLIVWEGHVAMYIGDGQMIEAPQPGDVVHIRPMRTTNAGMSFLGFWRPTA